MSDMTVTLIATQKNKGKKQRRKAEIKEETNEPNKIKYTGRKLNLCLPTTADSIALLKSKHKSS